MGFEIAFGVFDYNTSEVLNDPAHVVWNVYLEQRKDLKVVNETKVAIHKCTEDDYAKFYPVAADNLQVVTGAKRGDALYCIDQG